MSECLAPYARKAVTLQHKGTGAEGGASLLNVKGAPAQGLQEVNNHSGLTKFVENMELRNMLMILKRTMSTRRRMIVVAAV